MSLNGHAFRDAEEASRYYRPSPPDGLHCPTFRGRTVTPIPKDRCHSGFVRRRARRVPADRVRTRALDPGASARGPGRRLDRPGGRSAASPTKRLRVARLTVELIRPVSIAAPISLEARLIRPGRKVQIVEVIGRQDGIEVATARALTDPDCRYGPAGRGRMSRSPTPGSRELALTMDPRSRLRGHSTARGPSCALSRGLSSRQARPRSGCAFVCRSSAASRRPSWSGCRRGR